MADTEERVPSTYEINKTIDIFKGDDAFVALMDTNSISLDEADYVELVTILLEQQEYITSSSIEDLISESYLRQTLSDLFSKDFLETNVYEQVMYTFKYSTVKGFFKKNYERFLPSYDYLSIQSNEKTKAFVDALMQEFDRFADIIDEISNVTDVDKTPVEYLNYLAQIVGYEREDKELLSDNSFRELIKNIVEIYKRKGSNYSFELFFNFLGFEITVNEYWFDKRFYYISDLVGQNPYTSEENKNKFNFYLTPLNPTSVIPDDLTKKYIVSKDEIKGTLCLNTFNSLISAGTYTVEQLLGINTGFPNETYTYFKTNVVKFDLSSIKTSDQEYAEGELSEEDTEIIKKYIDFLSPIFIQKNISVYIKPYEESIYSTFLLTDSDKESDDDTTIPVSFNYINFGENTYTDDPIFDQTEDSYSVYDQISKANTDFTQTEILNQIYHEMGEAAIASKKDIDTILPPPFGVDISLLDLITSGSGTKYIAYTDSNSSNTVGIKYQLSGETTWNTLGSSLSSENTWSISLKLDSSDNPYIAFISGNSMETMEFMVKKYTEESGWEEVGDLSSITVNSNSKIELNISSSDDIYITYFDDESSSIITTRTWGGTTWDLIGTAGEITDVSRFSSTVDSSGNIYIVYIDTGNSNYITIRTWGGTTWDLVGTPGYVASTSSDTDIITDSSDNIYISYSDNGNSDYATVRTWGGTTWDLIGIAGFSNGAVYLTKLDISSTDSLYLFSIELEYDEGMGLYYSKPFVYNFDTSWSIVGGDTFLDENYDSMAIDFIIDDSDQPYSFMKITNYIYEYTHSTSWSYTSFSTIGLTTFTKLKVRFNDEKTITIDLVTDFDTDYPTTINNKINTGLGTIDFQYAVYIGSGEHKRLVIRTNTDINGNGESLITAVYNKLEDEEDNIAFILFDPKFIRVENDSSYNPYYTLNKVSANNYLFNYYLIDNEFINQRELLPLVFGTYKDGFSEMISDTIDEEIPTIIYATNFNYETGGEKRLDSTPKLDEGNYKVTNINTFTRTIMLNNDDVSTTNKIKKTNKIYLFGAKDVANDGVYTISSISEISDGYSITVNEKPAGYNQISTCGFCKIYYDEWKYNDGDISFLYDKDVNIIQE